MNYRAFADFRKGYAHVKNGSGVEDCADSYNDPEGRFYIGVICDGHSDKNCFRSAKGAQFGCESALEVLTRFFEQYLSQTDENRRLPDSFEDRLKKSLKACWDRKVNNDIKENPVREEELAPLTDRVRNIYTSGNGMLNIYGATFLAIGICEDFFLALHIGDGIILCIDEDGLYYSPVPYDPKSDTGGPASLCDNDLFSRENAFRISVSKKLPLLATVSSDGIEDCMDSFGYKRFIYALFKKLESEELEDQPGDELNEKQKIYFESSLDYYADRGHGAEDDCSLAAFYDLDRSVPEVRIPSDEAVRLWEQVIRERNDVVRDYEKRKSNLLENIRRLVTSQEYRGTLGITLGRWMEVHERFEEQKVILKTIVTNENEKIAYYEKQLEFYEQYIEDFPAKSTGMTKRLTVRDIDCSLLEPDDNYFEIKLLVEDAEKKQKLYDQSKKEYDQADSDLNKVYDEAKRRAKMSQEAGDESDRIQEAKDRFKRAKIARLSAKEALSNAIKAFEEARTRLFRNRTWESLSTYLAGIIDSLMSRQSQKPMQATGCDVQNGQSQKPMQATGCDVQNGQSQKSMQATSCDVQNGQSQKPMQATGYDAQNGQSQKPMQPTGCDVQNGQSQKSVQATACDAQKGQDPGKKRADMDSGTSQTTRPDSITGNSVAGDVDDANGSGTVLIKFLSGWTLK